MTTQPYNPAEDGAQMAFDGRMSYGDYLHIDRILTAQTPLSDAHDEMLFIIQHQTSELWMRLALHEIDAARRMIAADRAQEAFKMLARVARIFEQLNNAWDVLRTMTPSDYTTFREALGQSSGFQSWQYRLIEYAVGNRNLAMLKPHAHRPDLMAKLEAELARPSLYDEALRHLARNGLPVPQDVLTRDFGRPGPSTTVCRRCGRSSTATRPGTGRPMNWPRSWWISRIISAAGASIT
jgi:tryptophan 2,3-dioxygenase